jgi:hypothetical protein
MTDDPVTEWLVLAPAWRSLTDWVCTREENAMTIDPRELATRVREMADRAAALLFVHMHADSLAESAALVTALLARADAGRRPRTARELGLDVTRPRRDPGVGP